jgi:hypothetical protein
MNKKRTRQGYGVRSCLKLVLNKLKGMKGSTSIYTPLGIWFKEASKEVFMCSSSKKPFLKPFKLKVNYELSET